MKKAYQKRKINFVSFSLLTFFLASISSAFATSYLQILQEESYTEFKGFVVDAELKDPLAFATLNVNDTYISTITNSEGEFLLKVPNRYLDKKISILFLGYTTKEVLLSNLNGEDIHILLDVARTQLPEVSIIIPKDAQALVKAVLDRKGSNYYNKETKMTAFYRETIKKRRKEASLSEAVVEIYKQPYNTNKADAIKLIKARKKTYYNRLDTLALKLQGGPFSTLYVDFLKYPEFVFTNNNLSEYEFSFDTSTEINNKMVYVVKFKQRAEITDPLYYGKLYIDAETFALTSAIYNLNVENKKQVADMFIRRKPRKVTAYPTQAAYRIDYRIKDGKWYYGYSNIQLIFKVKWKGKLFNNIYTLNSEMTVTDLDENLFKTNKTNKKLRPSVILSDEVSGFSDPDFWGPYNIIEPEKSIESAINKINNKLKKS